MNTQNDLIEWITTQEGIARGFWQTATNDILNPNASASSLLLSRYQADYWNGYSHALANLRDELDNMPTKRGKHAR